MSVRYQDTLSGLTEQQFARFCVGWREPLSGRELYNILQNSYAFVLAFEGDTAAGFVNALSDGLKFAFIPMLEVLPPYQNQGIGTNLMTRLLAKLQNIQNIDLTCDPELQPFYERFEMLKSSGMVLRKYLTKEETARYRASKIL